MNFHKVDDKIILKPDNGQISQDFLDNFTSSNINITKCNDYFRIEHPNCAFFKGTHKAGDREIIRTTLYTPEGRLHIDLDEQNREEENVNKYVKKQDHLNTLLFYLRDVEVKPALKDINSENLSIQMPDTPLNEFYDFVDSDLFIQQILEYKLNTKHIFSQLRRIYNAKFDILVSKLKGKIDYAVFKDVGNIQLSKDIIEKWHYYYVRKARLLK